MRGRPRTEALEVHLEMKRTDVHKGQAAEKHGATSHRGEGRVFLQSKGKLGNMYGTQRSRLTFENSVAQAKPPA